MRPKRASDSDSSGKAPRPPISSARRWATPSSAADGRSSGTPAARRSALMPAARRRRSSGRSGAEGEDADGEGADGDDADGESAGGDDWGGEGADGSGAGDEDAGGASWGGRWGSPRTRRMGSSRQPGTAIMSRQRGSVSAGATIHDRGDRLGWPADGAVFPGMIPGSNPPIHRDPRRSAFGGRPGPRRTAMTLRSGFIVPALVLGLLAAGCTKKQETEAASSAPAPAPGPAPAAPAAAPATPATPAAGSPAAPATPAAPAAGEAGGAGGGGARRRHPRHARAPPMGRSSRTR